MSLWDQFSQLVLISLILKLFFLSVITFELMLPKIRNVKSNCYWSTDYRLEIETRAVEGGAFLFSIGFLLALDYLAAADSWVPFYVTLLLDIALVLSIVILLFSPKVVGITPEGVYLNGWIIRWEEIEDVDLTGNKVLLKRKSAFRENKRFCLPTDKKKADEVLREIRGKIRSGD